MLASTFVSFPTEPCTEMGADEVRCFFMLVRGNGWFLMLVLMTTRGRSSASWATSGGGCHCAVIVVRRCRRRHRQEVRQARPRRTLHIESAPAIQACNPSPKESGSSAPRWRSCLRDAVSENYSTHPRALALCAGLHPHDYPYHHHHHHRCASPLILPYLLSRFTCSA